MENNSETGIRLTPGWEFVRDLRAGGFAEESADSGAPFKFGFPLGERAINLLAGLRGTGIPWALAQDDPEQFLPPREGRTSAVWEAALEVERCRSAHLEKRLVGALAAMKRYS